MKKLIAPIALVFALTGCDQAADAINQAQKTANSAVASVQEQLEGVDLGELNLDQFGDTAGATQALAVSVQQIANADFTNPVEFDEMTAQFANAYSCLVNVSSEATAENLVETLIGSMTNEDALSLIDQGIEKAESAGQCVTQ